MLAAPAQTGAARQLEQGLLVADVGMHPTAAEQADDVQARAARPHMLHRGDECLILEEAPIVDLAVDERDRLDHHEPGAQVEMADLGVAHLARRQADVALGGMQQAPGAAGAPGVDVGRLRQADCVTLALLTLTPAI